MARLFFSTATGILAAAIGWVGPLTARAQAPFRRADHIDLSALAERHIQKLIDFDEVKLGNVETTPMYWVRHVAPGFPHYATGMIDRRVGHDAPPSFRLDLDGGSVAYHYRHPIIRVGPESDYRIRAWIKTAPLKHARAWLSVYFLDGSGRPMEESTQYSPLFGSIVEDEDWHPITLFLAGSNPRATHLGLSLWLVQREGWQARPSTVRWVNFHDLKGSVWIDDIEVTPLPHRTLGTDRPGHVFGPTEPVLLRVDVRESAFDKLKASIEVRDFTGRVIDRQRVAIRGKHDPEIPPVEVPDLSPGLYQARLILHARNGVLSDTSLTFAKLAPTLYARYGGSSHFGLVLNDLDDRFLEADRALIEHLNVGLIKFPIDLSMITADDPAALSNVRRDLFLRRLVANRKQLVATFTDPANGTVGGSSVGGRLLDILQADPESWRPGMTLILARFADLAFAWQLGADGDDRYIRDRRLPDALLRLRTELARTLTDPHIVAPWSAYHEFPDPPFTTDPVSVHVPANLPASALEKVLEADVGSAQGPVWAVIEPPLEHHYFREPRLADFAKRLILARAAGVRTVFTPRLWHVRERLGDRVLEPTEDYLIFRTITDVLGAGRPAGTMYLGPTVECRIFDRGGKAVLVLWDDLAPPGGRTLRVFLGPAPVRIDLFGNAARLAAVSGKHELKVSRMPVFVVGLDTWLQKFRAGFALEPNHLESSLARHEPDIVFKNPSSQSISGRFRLLVPDRWDVRPTQFRFALAPGEKFRGQITVRVPRNESAGDKTLTAVFELDADRPYTLRVVAPFEFGLRDIDVDSRYTLDGERLVVRVTVTNRSEQAVSFRLFVQAPGHRRLERFIYDLGPGRTVLKEYTLNRASTLVGKRVWIALRELRGSRVRNEWIPIR